MTKEETSLREEPTSDAVVQALDACLAAQAEGQAWSPEDFRELVGDRWDEFLECTELLHHMDPIAELLQDDLTEEVLPKQIGPYSVARLLGAGGFSRVYLALDPKLARPVAIKCFAASHTSIDKLRDWIATEARSLAQVNHEGVLRVHELLDTEEFQAVVTEHIPGPSLMDTIEALREDHSKATSTEAAFRGRAATQGLATHRDRAKLIAKLARALSACHEAGVLHRDIKPGNVLLASGVEPKLIDFGLSHLLEESINSAVTEAFIGSPAYLAPEQIEEEQTGARAASDQFSLGVILYELLTLQQPFLREGRQKTMQAVLAAEPPAPRNLDASIPRDLQWICLRAIERRPEDRYASAAEMAEDLEAFLEHRDIKAGPPGILLRAKRYARKHRRALATFLVGASMTLVLRQGVLMADQASMREQWRSDEQTALASLKDLEAADLANMNAAVSNALDTYGDLKQQAPSLGFDSQDLGIELGITTKRMISRSFDDVFAKEDFFCLPDLGTSNKVWAVHYPRLNQLPNFSSLSAQSCRVTLPANTTLMALGIENFPLLTEVENPGALLPGLYRMIQDTDHGGQEQTLVILDGLPILEPRFWTPPPWIEGQWQVIEVTDNDRSTIPGASKAPRSIRALAFDSLNPLHKQVLGESIARKFQGMADRMRAEPHGDNPNTFDQVGFCPTWLFAFEFAKRVGGRLATIGELRVLHNHGLLEEAPLGYWMEQSPLKTNTPGYVTVGLLDSNQEEVGTLESSDSYVQLKRFIVIFPGNP